MDITNEQLACKLLEFEYIKSRGRQVTYNLDNNYDLFPSDWFDNESYIVKIEILKEAIDKNILIHETEGYVKAFSDIVLD